MCGIVGYTGERSAINPLLNGLQRLEYRGYDSAGIFLNGEDKDFLLKEKGKVNKLKKLVEKTPEADAMAGIAHTRWATHGEVSVDNAHPHTDEHDRFFLVHNGVIENFNELKNKYLDGYTFKSDTDTEVAVQLIGKFVDDGYDIFAAFNKMISLLGEQSAYAFLLMDKNDKDTIYVSKKKSPMLIGKGKNGNVVASDPLAVIDIASDFVDLKDDEIAIITNSDIKIFENGEEVARDFFKVDLDVTDTDKGVYDFYMLKEIEEQPIIARKISNEYISENDIYNEKIISKELLESINNAEEIHIVAAGTSYHAGLSGSKIIEKLTKKRVFTHISSEFAYYPPIISDKSLFIFLSQSGETADSIEVLRNIKEDNYKSISITNVPNSTLARETDFYLPLFAGPEISVASTKAYTSQIMVEAILADAFAKNFGIENGINMRTELSRISVGMQSIIDEKSKIKDIADKYLVESNTDKAFYIGRGNDSFVSLEAALKLKEIAYILTEGYAAGELKHGTISLIEKDTPVFGIITESKTASLVRSNLSETVARGAKSFTIVSDNLSNESDDIVIPDINELFSPLYSVIPAQLIAYYTSLGKNLDVDKPRNLAKSVTVQ